MASIKVEVAYALREEQALLVVDTVEGTIVKEVIKQSEILDKYPEIDLETVKVGIFGKLTKMDQGVRDRDRIEIYRPLIADPKEVRRRKAAEGKKLKKGGAAAQEENKTEEKS